MNIFNFHRIRGSSGLAVQLQRFRNMNQTMSTSRRVAMYVTPVAVVSICLNIPKFMENEVKETDNTTQIDIAEMRLHPTYMLYYTISQIFHPTLTTGLVPMGVLIFMNLAIYKGNKEAHLLSLILLHITKLKYDG